MSLLDKKLYGRLTTNSGTKDFGQQTLDTLIKRVYLESRAMKAQGFSSGTFQFSVNEFKKTADSGEDESDINVMMRRAIERDGMTIEMESPEQAAARLALQPKQSHPMYDRWVRGTIALSGERFRQSLGADEWAAIARTAKELWPDEYESRKHHFNG